MSHCILTANESCLLLGKWLIESTTAFDCAPLGAVCLFYNQVFNVKYFKVWRARKNPIVQSNKTERAEDFLLYGTGRTIKSGLSLVSLKLERRRIWESRLEWWRYNRYALDRIPARRTTTIPPISVYTQTSNKYTPVSVNRVGARRKSSRGNRLGRTMTSTSTPRVQHNAHSTRLPYLLFFSTFCVQFATVILNRRYIKFIHQFQLARALVCLYLLYMQPIIF